MEQPKTSPTKKIAITVGILVVTAVVVVGLYLLLNEDLRVSVELHRVR